MSSESRYCPTSSLAAHRHCCSARRAVEKCELPKAAGVDTRMLVSCSCGRDAKCAPSTVRLVRDSLAFDAESKRSLLNDVEIITALSLSDDRFVRFDVDLERRKFARERGLRMIFFTHAHPLHPSHHLFQLVDGQRPERSTEIYHNRVGRSAPGRAPTRRTQRCSCPAALQ